ncbi:hypothetical protein GCM10018987_11110 [Streptomyces cremeus]
MFCGRRQKKGPTARVAYPIVYLAAPVPASLPSQSALAAPYDGIRELGSVHRCSRTPNRNLETCTGRHEAARQADGDNRTRTMPTTRLTCADGAAQAPSAHITRTGAEFSEPEPRRR